MEKENRTYPKGQTLSSEVREKTNKKKWANRIITLLIIILLLLLGLYKYGYLDDGQPDYIIGAGVKEGELSGDDSDTGGDAESGSNGTSSMRVKMNGYPVFSNGTSEGNLNIENPAENVLYMKAKITLDGTGEVIYESGAIPPNHYIDNDKLSKVLEKGTYKATAHLTLFDPENPGVQYNSANFNLVITINT